MTKNAYLIHGTSTKDDDWFPWLEQAAAPEIKVNRLDLPNPFNPEQNEWNQAVDAQIPVEDGITIIAHSLGCVTALRYVERHQIKDVNLILVGAFVDPLSAYPELNNFMNPAPDLSKIKSKISHATVITAVNDPIAPYKMAVKVANELGAKLIVRENGGHFLSSDGYTEFPLVLKELKGFN
ncbi:MULTISPECIES: alpha/beta hydrolase [Lactobacillus]|uniref:Serine hydrolase family protein n=1 Tax=Lactobacillus xujianguonis TaxID=2495899 RepID=A0A437STR7_9LACO|nr:MULTISPECIES: alpha/beta fold hydrolase [Lactobacillus]RVU70339.1 serine hydrolase family protein [Lactobacillus xujianguonis]RVU76882.1 serine hydrolase family protein [Lactobacillus xujianguonis]